MYIEGEVPYISGGNNGNGMWGQDGIWAILLLALLGNRGFGFGGGYGGGAGVVGGDLFGYQLGKVATTNDVASGFSTSEIMSDLNDILLGQATMQNFINQGFSGLNTSILTGFNGVDNAICTLGYNIQSGFNGLGHQISDCCCTTQRAIDSVNYNLAKSTCDIVTNANAQTQRIIDYLTNEKIEGLRAENVALKGRISNDAQSAYILERLSPCPKPAYYVPNPNCCYSPCGATTNTIIQ